MRKDKYVVDNVFGIVRRVAETCNFCGKTLWKPCFPVEYNKIGERVGYGIRHRKIFQYARCWNIELCEKRMAKKAGLVK